MITENLRAYAMYDMGGFSRNEIALRDEILNKSKGKYKVHAVRVDNIQEDESKGELRIGLEKIIPGDKNYGPHLELTLFNGDTVDDFLDDTDVDNPIDLLNRRLIGLFGPLKNLKWLIAYPYSVTQDDVNVTKIDVGDYSYLSGL